MTKTKPDLLEVSTEMSPECARGTQLILALMEALHKQGHKEVSRAQLLQLLGYDEEDITPDDETTMFVLTDAYLDNKEQILATLQSRTETKH